MLSYFLLVELKVVRVRVRGGEDKPDVPGNSERKPLKAGLGPCNSVERFAWVYGRSWMYRFLVTWSFIQTAYLVR